MSEREISFLSAFNAKEMPDREVARSFVSSGKFDELAGNWNSLLLGPRGSGKTTLLKMLRVTALRTWAGPEANRYREAIKFTGIFVPADVTWAEMIESLAHKELEKNLQATIVQSAFCTNVLLSLVDSFEARLTPTKDSPTPDYRLAQADRPELNAALTTICGLWKLEPRLMSISGMRAALQHRLLSIQAEVTKFVKRRDSDPADLEHALPFLYLHAISAVEFAVKQFDAAIGEPDGKWALLFDEFEIAPAEMQDMVFKRFRSAGNKVMIKVGLAPCTAHTMKSLAHVSEATVTNDYKQVKLWYPEKKGALEFSERLFKSKFGQACEGVEADPTRIFDSNSFVLDDEDDSETSSQPYGKGEEWKNVFLSLREKDESFRNFLVNKGIDPEKLDTSPKSLTGNTVRKIAPLVAFRDAFRRQGLAAPKRGRKKLNFAYAGWQAISAICEGNPRWLIGVLNMMLSAESSSSGIVKRSTQVGKIHEATEAFVSMLSLAPLEARGLFTRKPIEELLRQVGDYFFEKLIENDFIEEPPLSFFIDEKVSNDVQTAVRIAINHGALIHIPDPKDASQGFDELLGKRFRLAYLLAPRFKLPLRSTKSIALSTILLEAKNAGATSAIRADNQLELL